MILVRIEHIRERKPIADKLTELILLMRFEELCKKLGMVSDTEGDYV